MQDHSKPGNAGSILSSLTMSCRKIEPDAIPNAVRDLGRPTLQETVVSTTHGPEFVKLPPTPRCSIFIKAHKLFFAHEQDDTPLKLVEKLIGLIASNHIHEKYLYTNPNTNSNDLPLYVRSDILAGIFKASNISQLAAGNPQYLLDRDLSDCNHHGLTYLLHEYVKRYFQGDKPFRPILLKHALWIFEDWEKRSAKKTRAARKAYPDPVITILLKKMRKSGHKKIIKMLFTHFYHIQHYYTCTEYRSDRLYQCFADVLFGPESTNNTVNRHLFTYMLESHVYGKVVLEKLLFESCYV
ncbi:hypothetical protein SeLEV6574_g03009 [Synchytrium endobioticum]|uniref:Uncharacterized protein n=1 Tax=Synchytrium endobioticum TaxID=286115 RepID=A0A507D5G6_9FUNG|nr:hypothetical protein SeLEV6574_g03009 [Synchytrium endobioticum]